MCHLANSIGIITWNISFISGHASLCPPGISEGPYRAPSSPPLTPEPTKRKPCFFKSSQRRVVSWYSEFPPSMIKSPGDRSGVSCLIKSSTADPAVREIFFLVASIKTIFRSLD